MTTGIVKAYNPPRHYQPLVGADPELFVQDRTTQEYVTLHAHVLGTKKEPIERWYGAIQQDGCATEFNITPAKNLLEFIQRIRDGKRDVQQAARTANPNYEISTDPYVEFSQRVWDEIPKEFKILGCDPDFNALKKGAKNPHPACTDDMRIRTAGGHIHVGWVPEHEQEGFSVNNENHIKECVRLVQTMDSSLYVVSRLWDKEDRRTRLYGKPGAFRPKKYGVEYRTLSNAWLRNTNLTAWVYNATVRSSILWDMGVNPMKNEKILRNIVLSKTRPPWDDLLEAYELLVSKYEYPTLAMGGIYVRD